MSKPKFTQELIREEVRKALMVGPLSEINARISEVSRKLHIEHSLVVRSYCVTLAQIALGIMENAKDTIWISDTTGLPKNNPPHPSHGLPPSLKYSNNCIESSSTSNPTPNKTPKAKARKMEAEKHRGRPLKGGEKRITRSIRVEPTKRAMIERKYGTIQQWFDRNVEREFGNVTEIEIVRKKKTESVSVDDF